MRRIILLCLTAVFMLASGVAWAQERTVTGRVTSAEDGSALPGVNVVVKGTTNGTVTDVNGNYTLNAPSEGVLVFTFIGLQSREEAIGTRNTVDIQMATDTQQLSEVVVTAIGVEQNKRDITYSVRTVQSEDLTRVKATNILSSLQGKIPGASIQNTSGQPGSSQKILLRGMATLSNGSGQPLVVVDGIPINNSQLSEFDGAASLGDAGVFSDQTDAGNGIADIESENIESVSVLAGISAAALYGSRAANGAIIITTKNGSGAASRGKKSEITYSGGFTWESPLMLPKTQTVFGLGQYNNNLAYINDQETWGDPYDGSLRPFSQVIDNQQLFKRYEATPQTLRNAFNTGFTTKNTISLAGGTPDANYYTSYTFLDQTGIVPGSGMKRHNVKVAGSSELANKITVGGSVEFIHSDLKTTPQGFGGNSDASFYGNLLRTSSDLITTEARDYKNKFYDVAGYFTPFNGNPFRAAYTWEDVTKSNRVFGNVHVSYAPVEWLSFTVRAGGDFTGRQLEQYRPKESAGAPNNINRPGTIRVVNRNSEEINVDAMANLNRDLAQDLNLNLLIGYNLQSQLLETVSAQQPNLGIPGFRSLNNALVSPLISGADSRRRAIGAYSRAVLGYKQTYHLELQARNDWSSTLPEQNRSNLYWSAGGNIIISELTELGPVNFLKLKATYAKVGNDAPAYSTRSTFLVGLDPNINPNTNFPFAGVTGVTASNSVGNANLKPETTSGWEAGFEVGVLQERISMNLTYYDQLSEDLITTVQVPGVTGYTGTVLNAGAMRNKGIEISLTAIPVETEDFSWRATLNYSRNRTKMESLAPGLDEYQLGGFSAGGASVNTVAVPGELYGLWKYTTYVKDDAGNLVIDEVTGRPVLDNTGNITDGRSIQPDFNGAFINTFTYKGFTLSLNVQGQFGGYFFSQTKRELEAPGKTSSTTYNMRQPWIVPGSVIDNGDGTYTPNTSIFVTDPNQYWNNRGMEDFILDATYVKLRELSISYRFPKKFFNGTPITNVSLSLIGSNLWMWTPNENRYSDPEMAQGFGVGSDGDPGFEYAPIPPARAYGFSLRVTL